MTGAFSASWSTVRAVRGASGHRRSPAGRWRPFSLERGRSPRGAVPAREGVGGLEVKVPLVEPFTRLMSRDFAQDVMDAHLARVDPDEMA
jgi:hypothetical protein